MLVTEDGFGLDRFVEFVGIHEGLAFELEDSDLALLGQAVEGRGANLEFAAGLLPGIVSLFTLLGDFCANLGNGLGDDGFQDILDESPNHICFRHNCWLFRIVSEKESRRPATGLVATTKI